MHYLRGAGSRREQTRGQRCGALLQLLSEGEISPRQSQGTTHQHFPTSRARFHSRREQTCTCTCEEKSSSGRPCPRPSPSPTQRPAAPSLQGAKETTSPSGDLVPSMCGQPPAGLQGRPQRRLVAGGGRGLPPPLLETRLPLLCRVSGREREGVAGLKM